MSWNDEQHGRGRRAHRRAPAPRPVHLVFQAVNLQLLPSFECLFIGAWQQRLTFPFPFVHHQSHDWKVERLRDNY